METLTDWVGCLLAVSLAPVFEVVFDFAKFLFKTPARIEVVAMLSISGSMLSLSLFAVCWLALDPGLGPAGVCVSKSGTFISSSAVLKISRIYACRELCEGIGISVALNEA